MMVALERPALVHTLSLDEPALVSMVPSGTGFAPALAPAVAKYQSHNNLEAVDIFLRLVCGADYRKELE
jgi:hypothetical protein